MSDVDEIYLKYLILPCIYYFHSFFVRIMTMYDEYEAFTKKYQEEFGKDTIVLYQCGSFYEIYSIDDGLVNIKLIADILDVQLSKRNKKDPVMNRANCLFLGWPLIALNKFLPILVEHNFTVVIVNQVSKNMEKMEKVGKKVNGKEIREVTNIYSKGTFLENIDGNMNHHNSCNANGRFIICMYVEKCANHKLNTQLLSTNKLSNFAFGISIIEVSTGINHYKEILPCSKDSLYTSDELYRITSRFPALEIILISLFHTEMLEMNDITNCLKVDPSCHLVNRLNKMNKDLTKIQRQNLVLSKVFPDTGMLSPIEYTDMERAHYARVSYVSLMEYLFLHNENIVIKLRTPEELEKSNLDADSYNHHLQSSSSLPPLILSYNAVDQLDISQGLVSILNKCQTLMGRRYFRDRLMNPTYDESFLLRSYEATQELSGRGIKFVERVRKELANMYDLERLFRKVVMGNSSLNDLAHIVQSLSALQSVFNLCDNKSYTSPLVPDYTRSLLEFIRPLIKPLNVNESMNDGESINTGIYGQFGLNLEVFPDIKEKEGRVDAIKTELHDVVASLNGFCDDSLMNQSGQACFFRLDKNDRDGYFLICTAKRLGLIKSKLVGYNCTRFSFDDATISGRGDGFKVSHPYFSECTEKIVRLNEMIESETNKVLSQILGHISEHFYDMLKPLCDEINYIDFLSNNAYIAITKNYCRPTIHGIQGESNGTENHIPLDMDIDDTHDYQNTIICKQLRHPLVEDADQKVAFVGNDVTIGPNNNLLLYGLNAAGKSTLMKSIAIAIIMAQAGMYVPATSFQYIPFRSLFTRITKGDDIKKHQSTFMVEMQELRSILKRANRHSLVIGDELCGAT